MSRIPRKVMSRRGSQFNWMGAEIPSAVGGKRAHPPKVISKINTKKINKKELRIAFESALSASANEKKISERYKRLESKKIEKVPFVVESKISSLKTKNLISSIKKILGKDLFEIAIPKKSIRKGKGKLRGRKYKSSAGLLIVVGDKEKIQTKVFEVVSIKNLSISDLSRGGLGRLTLYTEQAIKDLGKKFK
jgi:large subunit ribosomal protein L4e